jgi:hypothetical protein
MAPIGSFESGWEDYDHTSGPALREEGKELYKGGSSAAPNWRLQIGTEEFTSRLISAEVTFSREGESGISFVVAANLRALQYERARVSFWFGYGTKIVPYFRGRLAAPTDSANGLNGEATAYGLATQLGNRYFQGRVNYGGMDLRSAVADIWDRFGADPERFYFGGEHSTELASKLGSFGLEVSLLEALQTVLEPMQFVGYDQAGGMYIVQRSHLASLGTDEVFSGAGHYEIEDYPKNGFIFSESMQNQYASVTVFRRNEEWAGGGGEGAPGGPAPANPDESELGDEYAVYANVPVTNSGIFNVHEGRDYVIADYPGQQEHAEREAELLATALERGVGRFEWTCPPIDFSIGDHFTVKRHEQIIDPETAFDYSVYSTPRLDAVSYACVAEEITFPLVARDDPSFSPDIVRWGPMTVSGQAFESARTTLRPASSSPITLAVPVGSL